MPPLKSILVMADRSAEAQIALQKAFVIARHFDASIELLACDPDRAWTARGAGARATGERAAAMRSLDGKRFLEALCSTISADDLQIRTSEDFDGPLHEGIARRVRDAGHNLVVARINRREVPRRSSLASTDWQMIRSCPVPLFLTRGRPWRPLPRFVAGLESPGSTTGASRAEVLSVARYLADGCRGVLEIVYDEPSETRHPDLDPAALLAAVAAPGDVDVVVLQAFADVAGTRRRGPYAAGFAAAGTRAGTTLAETIVESLDCDVLLMPRLRAA